MHDGQFLVSTRWHIPGNGPTLNDTVTWIQIVEIGPEIEQFYIGDYKIVQTHDTLTVAHVGVVHSYINLW